MASRVLPMAIGALRAGASVREAPTGRRRRLRPWMQPYVDALVASMPATTRRACSSTRAQAECVAALDRHHRRGPLWSDAGLEPEDIGGRRHRAVRPRALRGGGRRDGGRVRRVRRRHPQLMVARSAADQRHLRRGRRLPGRHARPRRPRVGPGAAITQGDAALDDNDELTSSCWRRSPSAWRARLTVLEPDPVITCIDCGGRAHLLSKPHVDPEDGSAPALGGRRHRRYRCADCLDRWDLVLEDDAERTETPVRHELAGRTRRARAAPRGFAERCGIPSAQPTRAPPRTRH